MYGSELPSLFLTSSILNPKSEGFFKLFFVKVSGPSKEELKVSDVAKGVFESGALMF